METISKKALEMLLTKIDLWEIMYIRDEKGYIYDGEDKIIEFIKNVDSETGVIVTENQLNKEKIIKNALYIGRNPNSEKNLVIIFDTEKNVKRLLKGYYSIPVDDYFLFGNIERVAIMGINKNTFIAEYYNSIGRLVSRKLICNCNSTEEAFRKIYPDKEIQSVNRHYIDEEGI